MLCFSHSQLYEKGEVEKNDVVLPLARNGEAKTRRTSLSIFNSPIFPTALYIDKDVKYWKSILAYRLHYFLDISFSDYFAVHDAMFVFQFHLCEEKAGKHDVVYFREY